jgi:hypothetical protein
MHILHAVAQNIVRGFQKAKAFLRVEFNLGDTPLNSLKSPIRHPKELV